MAQGWVVATRWTGTESVADLHISRLSFASRPLPGVQRHGIERLSSAVGDYHQMRDNTESVSFNRKTTFAKTAWRRLSPVHAVPQTAVPATPERQ